MNHGFSGTTLADLPPAAISQILSNPASIADLAPERRRHGVSDLELGATLLSHAVLYLTSEQRKGKCTSVRANRQAITILCECAESLARLEQREPARRALYGWLDRTKRV